MASTAAGAPGTSQFYINLANNTSLDGNYAVFGKVINGLAIVQTIGSAPVEADPGNSQLHEPVTPVTIYTVTVST
jgi:cyclophilin family peptidyl-prolyl cis-trans isomerase